MQPLQQAVAAKTTQSDSSNRIRLEPPSMVRHSMRGAIRGTPNTAHARQSTH
jgi:hypothetical protein